MALVRAKAFALYFLILQRSRRKEREDGRGDSFGSGGSVYYSAIDATNDTAVLEDVLKANGVASQ
jgi:hypothetical protein